MTFDGMSMGAIEADLKRLEMLTEFAQPKVAVEIGSWAGRTAIIIANHAKRTFCVDHWKGNVYWKKCAPEDAFKTFAKNMGERFLTTVFPCVGNSLDWAAVWSVPIDFLYIDADHSYEGCKADIMAWAPHVVKGGVIAGHDYTDHDEFPNKFPGVAMAVDEIYPNRNVIPGSSVWFVANRPFSP
jgi:predicted O-methyltransferase YrrM